MPRQRIVWWIGAGNWQFQTDHTRLYPLIIWTIVHVRPLVCRFAGHQPQDYSKLPEFNRLRLCARCFRDTSQR